MEVGGTGRDRCTCLVCSVWRCTLIVRVVNPKAMRVAGSIRFHQPPAMKPLFSYGHPLKCTDIKRTCSSVSFDKYIHCGIHPMIKTQNISSTPEISLTPLLSQAPPMATPVLIFLSTDYVLTSYKWNQTVCTFQCVASFVQPSVCDTHVYLCQ